jgi:hypothetical protein
MRIDSLGRVGIGTASPIFGLDVADPSTMVLGGSDDNLGRTNGHNKSSRVGGIAYTNADLPVNMMMHTSTAADSILNFGWGTSAMNCPTKIIFGTAANVGTASNDAANKRMQIESNGDVNIAGRLGVGISPSEKLDLNGTMMLRNTTAPTTTTNRLYASGGNLFWNGQDVLNARDTIGELEDTSIGTKSNGQLLIWNATSSKWVNNTLTGGGGIDVTNAAGGISVSHTDTSSQSSSNNSGRTYIQDIELDAYGHVTSLETATETVVNTNTTYSAGNGLGLTGTVFSISSDLIGKVHSIGDSTADNIVTAVNSISFKTGNALKAKLFSSGSFHVADDVIAFSSSLSDKRLKNDINQIKGALNIVKQMRGVDYIWNKGSRKGQKDIGVIAQEVERVIPEVVKEHVIEVGEFQGDETKYKTVDYEKIVPVLIEAIKELSTKLDKECCTKCSCNK